MSFQTVRNYPRHILPSLVVDPLQQVFPAQEEALAHYKPATNDSPHWTATIHTFPGATPRFYNACHPITNIDKEPPRTRDPNFALRYDPETAKAKSGAASTYSLLRVGKSDEPAPTLVAKRCVPKKPVKSASGHGLTLIFLPGMGFVKELLEPMIDSMFTSQDFSNVPIEEIWILDYSMMGEAALRNPIGHTIGDEKDLTRDLIQFLTCYLPVQPTGTSSLPTRLPLRLSADAPLPTTIKTRPGVHLVGHSLGGQASILTAAHAPDLISSLILVDPVVVPPGKAQEAMTSIPSEAFCVGLKDNLPHKDAVHAEVAEGKRTKGWAAACKKLFEDRGYVQKVDGTFRLICRPINEFTIYHDKTSPVNAFDRLQDLKLPIYMILPPRPFGIPAKFLDTVFASLPKGSKYDVVASTTHNLPYERPDACGAYVASWLRHLITAPAAAKL